MCCGDKEMHGHHAEHIGQGSHHGGMANGMCGCGCRRTEIP
jgi:hypothetical protein